MEWAERAAELGAGEILLTSMDRDGTGDGFDLQLTRTVADAVGVPVIASGGVGTLDHLVEGIVEGHADAVLAASIFHYGQHTIAEAKTLLANAGVASSGRDSHFDRIGTGRPFRVQVRTEKTNMEYRPLGRSGIKVSVLSFGSWVTFDNQVAVDAAVECMQVARDAGCNFFDNAEAYAGGRSEEIMGEALRRLEWPRWSYVVTTKLFWGLHDSVNMKDTLNRKYLLQAIDGSLERFGLDFVDVLYCHRPDPDTPIEETVWAMSDIVASGKALYWGTSEWSADEIRAAIEIAERHHLRKPVTEQPQYNLLQRERVEVEYAELFDEFGYGTTTWSPLASGLLTGKYRDGIPADSRGALPGYGWLAKDVTDPAAVAKVEQLRPVADELGCTLAQLALAWCTKNPNVSTVITGASRSSQVVENFAALDVIPALTPAILDRIDAAVA